MTVGVSIVDTRGARSKHPPLTFFFYKTVPPSAFVTWRGARGAIVLGNVISHRTYHDKTCATLSHPHSFSFGRDLSRCPPSPAPSLLYDRQPDSLDDVQVTSFLLTSDGRRPFRARPRRLIMLLFAAAVAILVLFSQRPLVSEYFQPHQALFIPRPLIPPSSATPTATPVTQTDVRPVYALASEMSKCVPCCHVFRVIARVLDLSKSVPVFADEHVTLPLRLAFAVVSNVQRSTILLPRAL